jgi:hypothetical protein
VTTGPSGSPQARKLGLTSGQRLSLDAPPAGWTLIDPPVDVTVVAPSQAADVIIAFFTAAAQIPDRLPDLVQRIYPSGALWIAWPRRAGGHESDITDNVIRREALSHGVVDVKVAAIDDDWSGLRFVWRTEHRLPPAPAG